MMGEPRLLGTVSSVQLVACMPFPFFFFFHLFFIYSHFCLSIREKSLPAVGSQ